MPVSIMVTTLTVAVLLDSLTPKTVNGKIDFYMTPFSKNSQRNLPCLDPREREGLAPFLKFISYIFEFIKFSRTRKKTRTIYFDVL